MKIFWLKVSVQVVAILIATEVIAISTRLYKAYMDAPIFIGSNEFIFMLCVFSAALIALVFSIHAYFQSRRYAKERKGIIDTLIFLSQKISSIDELEQEIQRLDSDVNRPSYTEMINRIFNTKIDT